MELLLGPHISEIVVAKFHQTNTVAKAFGTIASKPNQSASSIKLENIEKLKVDALLSDKTHSCFGEYRS